MRPGPVLAAIALCSVQAAGLGPSVLETTIAAQRALLERRDLDGPARVSAVTTLLEAQERLLDETADDDHEALAARLAALAADHFFLVLPMDGADLTCDFGLPTPPQRERARRSAERIDILAAEAEQVIGRAILDIESTKGYDRDVVAQLRRRRLAADERDRRIPFLRGVGAYLRARLIEAPGTAQRDGFGLALAALEPLLEALPPSTATTALRYAGLARLRLGDTLAGRAHLERVIADAPGAGGGDAGGGDVIAARLGLVDAAGAEGGIAAAQRELDRVEADFAHQVPALRLLFAERRLLSRLEQAAAPEPGRPRDELLTAAWAGYLALLDEPGFAGDRDAWQTLLLAKIAGAVGPDAPWPALPPLVAVARARALGDEASTVTEALSLLERTALRRDLGDRERIAILFETGRALLRAGRVDEAADRFTELAREHPGDAAAERSIGLAAEIAADQCRSRPGDEAARHRLAATLAVLLEQFPGAIGADRWRVEAARVARAEGRFAEAAALLEQVTPDAAEWLDAQVERIDVLAADAIRGPGGAMRPAAERVPLGRRVRDAAQQLRPRLLEVAGRDPNRWADALLRLAVAEASAALAMDDPEGAIEALDRSGDAAPTASADASAARAALVRIDAYTALRRPDDVQREIARLVAGAGPRAGPILLAMLEERSAAVRLLAEAGRDDEAAARAASELSPVADALASWLGTPGGDEALRTTVSLGVAEAWRLARRWREAEAIYADLARRTPDVLVVLAGRAECLYALGEDAASMAFYRRIATQSQEGGPHWWQAQLRMLQVLDRTGKNTQRIAPQIRQLRQLDASLGGDRLRREFDRLERKHH